MSKKYLFGSVTFCEQGQLKGWKPHFPPTVAKSSIETQIRNLRQRDGIFCKHNTSIMHSWWGVLPTLSFWSGVDAWHFAKEWQEWTPETNMPNHVEQVSFQSFCRWSGGFLFTKGMDSLDKPVNKSLFVHHI